MYQEILRAYVKTIEKAKSFKGKPKKKEESVGLLSRSSKPKEEKRDIDSVELIAALVVQVARKRAELKNGRK